MKIALRSRTLVVAFALVAGVGTLVVSNSAQAQVPGTGASADKNCPGATASLGQTITCSFTVANIGTSAAQVTLLQERSPFPGGTPVNISCTAGGASISTGSTLQPGVTCSGTFVVTVANDPTLCNTFVLDRVDIELLYTNFPQPLVAGAFATEVTQIVCEETTTTAAPTTTVPGPTTTAAPTTTVPGSPTTARPTTTIRSGLPATGTSSGVTLAAAVGFTALGAAALMLSRRRAS